MSHCPGCKCPEAFAPSDQAARYVEELRVTYGSVKAAGRAYSERYGLYLGNGRGSSSGARLMERIRLGYVSKVTVETLDRLETLAAS